MTAALVVVSLTALGVIGLEVTRPHPDRSDVAAPVESSSSPAPPSTSPPHTPVVVDEPFDPTAPIPGCATVEQPDTRGGYSAVTSFGTQSYDNPKFPWFSGPKATAMSDGLLDDLPDGAELVFDSPSRSLVFPPIIDFGEQDAGEGATTAVGSIVRDGAQGDLYVTVQKSDRPIPPCVAGDLDERRTLPDGTVVDVHDTWTETDGKRRSSRTATAYATDGSRIGAGADDQIGRTGGEFGGRMPLTVDDLARVAADPRLRVSTPVPPGTPAPRARCSAGFGESDAPPVTREQARRLDAVLAGVRPGGVPFLPLQVSDSSRSTLCSTTADPDAPAGVDIAITGGKTPPAPERPDPTNAGEDRRALPDGTVVETTRGVSGPSMSFSGEQQVPEALTVVTVTRPSGTEIVVTSHATPRTTPAPPLSDDEVRAIALTPGLEF